MYDIGVCLVVYCCPVSDPLALLSMAEEPEQVNSRQKLRPWLTRLLDEGKTPGLRWIENDKGVVDKVKFRIPWRHRGKHDWDLYKDESQVFKVSTTTYKPQNVFDFRVNT